MKIRNIKNCLLVKLGFVRKKIKQNLVPRVLFYHGVANIKNGFVESLHIPPHRFKRQLAYLRKHYEIISMDEYYQRWSTGTFTGKEVTLTFDDGYKNNLSVLAPILKEYAIPFTVFISTQHIDTGLRFPTFIGRAVMMDQTLSQIQIPYLGIETSLGSTSQRRHLFKKINYSLKHCDIQTVNLITEQLRKNLSDTAYQQLCDTYSSDSVMTWEEVKRLQEEYNCTIGSHCLEHFICDSFQEKSEIKRQITDSKAIIEQKLNTPCWYFAYPNGNICETALQATQEAGYRMGFITRNERLTPKTSPFMIPRYGVDFNQNNFIAELAFKPK